MNWKTAADIDAVPLEEIDVSRPELYLNDTWQPWFARLRKEAPVHFLADSVNGPFWSVSSHQLIKEVDARLIMVVQGFCDDRFAETTAVANTRVGL